jgi:type I restriction enzyme R subunit
MTSWLNEQVVEDAAVGYFRDLGYDHVHGSEIEPDGKHPERESFAEVLLLGRLEEAIERINPGVPHDVLIEAIRTIQRLDAPSLIANNEAFHKFLFEGVILEACGKDGETSNGNRSCSR